MMNGLGIYISSVLRQLLTCLLIYTLFISNAEYRPYGIQVLSVLMYVSRDTIIEMMDKVDQSVY